MKNMNKGITSFKLNRCPKAYRLKRDKMPVMPFLSLSSGGRSRRREGQKGRLGELRVAEDTEKASRRPPKGWTVMTAPEAVLEDEAAGHQYATKASVPAYSDMTTLPPAFFLFLFRSLPTPAAKETAPRSSRSRRRG